MQLERIFQDTNSGFISESTRDNLKILEARRRQLLVNQEASWRLKSREIWLKNEDENTKFFKPTQMDRKQPIQSGV
jgi:hypothetical protein